MSLSPGARLGPYEILSTLGVGGMGEVYRARDTKLNRDVAIKVLLPAVANDPDRLARFSREAQVLASLNHPNIAHIHGLEEADGVRALVMELVEGEDLSQRIARGPIPLDDALPIARQIADALEAAHEHGVIHRDLKPANIKIRSDGTVKVLDFGLAKAVDPAAGSSATAMNSPTLSIHATQAGIILGTAAYMSPEQARGKPVDRRTDIWSFGCVLFECLAGRQIFQGETLSDTVAKILERDPDWSALPAQTPPKVRELLRRCLEKDLKKRQRDIGDAGIELEEAVAARTTSSTFVGGASAPAPRLERRWRERSMWIGAVAVLMATTGIALWRARPGPAATVGPTVRATLPFASAELLTVNAFPTVALSPDGHSLAYRGGTPPQLYVRRMDENRSHPIPGTEGGLYPFFSPDGASLGFLSGRTIKRMAPSGGAPVGVIDLTTANLRGVAWGDDGWIYYTPTVSAGLWRVRATGGAPEQLTTPDFAAGEKTHRFPCVLPGSKAVLFMVGTSRIASFDDARIEVLSLNTRTRHRLFDGGSYPQYAATGHVLYTRSGRLIAVPFDAERLELTGPPVAVADDMFTDPYYGMGNYAVSRDGLFVRVVGGASSMLQSLITVDRHGVSQPTKVAPAASSGGSVSPDGTRYATSLLGATSQISIVDLVRGTATRLTYEWDNESPIWSPDGARIAFTSNHGGGPRNLYWQRADGSGTPERLTTSDHEQSPFSWSADGKTIAYIDTDPATGADIWTVSVADHKAAPLVKSPVDDTGPAFSPDGHWIAYQSSQGGKADIYVQAFPNADRRWQVSTDGGTQARWQRDGREIVYRNGQEVLAVPVTTSPTFHSGEPVTLFKTPNPLFDVLPEGRFLMRTSTPAPPVTELEVVVNWFTELRRKVAGR